MRNDLPRRILVVDDDQETADTITKLLCSMGHEVRAVYGRPEALEVARTFRPHLIVLDPDMPDFSGWQLIGSLRADIANSDLIIIAHTNLCDSKDIDRLSQSGFNRYLPKPADTATIRAMVENCLLFATSR